MPDYLEKQHGDVHNYANQLEISAFGHQIIDLVKSVCSDGTNTPYVMSIHHHKISKAVFITNKYPLAQKSVAKVQDRSGK